MDILIYSLVAITLLVAYVLYRVANPCNTCVAPSSSPTPSPRTYDTPRYPSPVTSSGTYDVYTPTHTETLTTVATAAVVANLVSDHQSPSFWSNPSYDFEPEPSKPTHTSTSSSSSFGYDDSHYSSSSYSDSSSSSCSSSSSSD